MIDEFSSSYPVRGAADACGVPLTLAYPYVWANRLWEEAQASGNGLNAALEGLTAAWVAITTAHGEATTMAFQERVEAGIMDGRVYWPYPKFFEARALQAERRIPTVRDDDDGIAPPVQPEPVD